MLNAHERRDTKLVSEVIIEANSKIKLRLPQPVDPTLRSFMDDISRLINSLNEGDETASNEFYAAVYAELRRIAAHKMASERPGHTLQATALVNEAYLRLSGSGGQIWENRRHFFTAAAEAMRRILVDSARRKNQLKRGENPERVDLNESQIVAPIEEEKLLQVHEALDSLAREDPTAADVVKLRFFVGLNHQETAQALEIGETTVRRHWAAAKLRLYDLITEPSVEPEAST